MASLAKEEKCEESSDSGAEVVFVGPDCPVHKVTVYPDRAEVCRRVEGNLVAGINQVVIKQLPDMVDPDSIRSVSCVFT